MKVKSLEVMDKRIMMSRQQCKMGSLGCLVLVSSGENECLSVCAGHYHCTKTWLQGEQPKGSLLAVPCLLCCFSYCALGHSGRTWLGPGLF